MSSGNESHGQIMELVRKREQLCINDMNLRETGEVELELELLDLEIPISLDHIPLINRRPFYCSPDTTKLFQYNHSSSTSKS